MRVFQDPITGTYTREDGKPGYGCHRCGNGYATAETRDDTAAHGCAGLDRDIASFADSQGLFAEGYTADDIDALECSTVDFLCVWEYQDDLGFAGSSEIIGRNINPDGSRGPWKYLDENFWTYLLYPDGNPETVPLDSVNALLSQMDFERQDVEDYPAFTGTNAAFKTL